MNITINKDEYGFVEEDQCQQIIKEITGGTVSEARGPINDWTIANELERKKPVGTTVFTLKDEIELIRLPNGGFHIFRPSDDSHDFYQGGINKFLDTHTAFVWSMHHGLVSSLDDFTRSVDRVMCHRDAKRLSQSNSLMAHKMETQTEIFKVRVRELLDLKAFRKCVMLIDGKITVIEITESMAMTIEQLCQPEGEDYGTPRDDVDGFPELSSLREELEEAQIGELKSHTETCYLVTKCASSKWDFPVKLRKSKEHHAVWCLPIEPIGKIDTKELAISAVTLCVLAEAWLTAIEWPDWGWLLDRATLRGRQTEQHQCAVCPDSPNIFSKENLNA